MKFERENAKAIDPVSEAQLRRALGYMHGASGSTFARLVADDTSYVWVGGRNMTCCLGWRNIERKQIFLASQHPPLAPWPGVSNLPTGAGLIALRQ